MEVRSGEDEYYQRKKYDGRNNPSDHLVTCQATWKLRPKEEWVHAFIHTLNETPWISYVSVEMQREITTWEELTTSFNNNFSFIDESQFIHSALQKIRDKVLEIVPTGLSTEPKWTLTP